MTFPVRSVVLLVVLSAVGLFSPKSIWAQGQATVSVEAGWGGRVKPGTWTPVFVTVSSLKPTSAVLEIQTPHDSVNAMRISVALTATPTPETYPLVVPLTYALDETVASLSDARTGRTLSDARFASTQQPFNPYTSTDRTLMVGELFAGVSGRESTERLLAASLDRVQIKSGFLPQRRLPTTPTGYDALDVLMLCSPDLVTMDPLAQQAIVDWVRAGGVLVYWPGDETLPDSGPIVDLLPARYGPNTTLDIPKTNLEMLGLGDRFATLRARAFSRAPTSTPIALLGGAHGARQAVGFGQVIALSFDASLLQFNDNEKAHAFWKPILSPALDLPEPNKPTQNAYTSARQTRHSNATTEAMDLIGTIPGLGQFDFKGVALVLGGLILLVGPIDWFVLKKLKREPLTWLTTAGWIVLVSAGAVYAGHWIKSGDLHLRSLRMVDQADGNVVATTDLTCIYSPQTKRYDLTAPGETWWRPAAPQQAYYGSGTSTQTMLFHQTPGSNRVMEGSLLVNIWNMKFLIGETIQVAPPLVETDLKTDMQIRIGNVAALTGSVTNLSGHAMTSLAVQTRAGWYRADVDVPASVTLPVTFTYAPDDEQFKPDIDYNRYYQRQITSDTDASEMVRYAVLGGIAPARSEMIDRWLGENDNHAVLYATVSDPDATVRLNDESPKEKHWQLVRALVKLKP